LAIAISSAAVAGTVVSTSTTVAAATKAIAMTILQKTFITATITVLAGAGVYEAREAAQLRDQVHTIQKQQGPLIAQIRQLRDEKNSEDSRIAELTDELTSAKKNNGELLKLRSEVALLRAQVAEARSSTSRAAQPSLATAREYYNRAGTHYINHDFEAQLEDLNKAIELDPNLAEAYQMRGDLYAQSLPKQRGGYEQAVKDYTRCLELKPNEAAARWNRAMYYADLARYDEALADWTVYIEGDTDFSHQVEGNMKALAGAHFYRGRVFHSNKRDYAKAIADYTSALQMDPTIEGAHRRRGECYEALGQTNNAGQDFAIEPRRN
jgi:tetratricopeptide (TPR) repeat protein